MTKRIEGKMINRKEKRKTSDFEISVGYNENNDLILIIYKEYLLGYKGLTKQNLPNIKSR